jgi:molybdopterin molybdotransferase
MPLEDARRTILDAARPLEAEVVPVGEAAGRVLAEDVHADHDVPPFANSAMDGFAVKAGPAGRTLTVVDESRAGAPAAAGVGEGEAIRISTGAVLPTGADAVVMVERTTDVGPGRVRLEGEAVAGQFVRGAGDDVRAGSRALAAGIVLGPAEVGAAITAGRATVRCARRPRVAILVTGDELREPGAPLGPGAIHDTNGPLLRLRAERAGGVVTSVARVPDEPAAVRAAIAAALDAADVLVVTGGVSVGPHDHVKAALAEQGVAEAFWRVALRPGKPTWFGTRGPQLVFGLPGNPVSAYVTFGVFVRPALLALQGAPGAVERGTARLAVDVPRQAARVDLVRVTLRDGLATPTGPQGSHVLSSLVGADGLAVITAGEGVAEQGSVVEVEPL